MNQFCKALIAIAIASQSPAFCQNANSPVSATPDSAHSSESSPASTSSQPPEPSVALEQPAEDNSLSAGRPREQKMAVITRRREKLQNIINLASDQGVLPADVRDQMNAELKRIAGEQEATSTLPTQSCHGKIMDLARDLDSISYKLNVTLHEDVANPLIVNGKLRQSHNKHKASNQVEK